MTIKVWQLTIVVCFICPSKHWWLYGVRIYEGCKVSVRFKATCKSLLFILDEISTQFYHHANWLFKV